MSFSQSLSIIYSSKSEQDSRALDSLKNNNRFNDYRNLSDTNDSTLSSLYKNGYLNLLAKPLLKANDSTYIQELHLGRRYSTIKIVTLSKESYIDSLMQIPLSRKQHKNYVSTKNLESKIKELYTYLSNKGHTFTTIKTKDIVFNETDTVEIRLEVKTNEIRHIDNIKIKGYPDFPRRYIENIIKRKYIINDNNINKIKETFKKLNFIEVVKDQELLFKKDSTTLYVYVKKKQNNLMDGLIGFNNTEGTKLEINGTLDLLLNNNLNNGEQLHLLYRGDDKDQTQLDIKIELPYLLKTKIGIRTGLNFLRRDSTYQNTTFNTGLFYSFNPQTTSGLDFSNTKSTTTNDINTNTNFTTQSLTLNFKHALNSTDILFIYDQLAQIEIGSGIRKTNSANTNQFKIKALLKKNIYLTTQHSIHLEGQLKMLNSDDILFNELFQVGGINSIRGFNQNSIDTSFFTAINTEYRYRISRGIYLHSILDYGIFEDYRRLKTENLYGIGIGTAILTQSGILRLSVANGTFSRANLDLSSTVAHINLKIRF